MKHQVRQRTIDDYDGIGSNAQAAPFHQLLLQVCSDRSRQGAGRASCGSLKPGYEELEREMTTGASCDPASTGLDPASYVPCDLPQVVLDGVHLLLHYSRAVCLVTICHRHI